MMIKKHRRKFNKALKAQTRNNYRFDHEGFVFYPKSKEEFYRYASLLTKEPGTIQWIDENVRPRNVVYDIGANLGLYTLYAARKDVIVYAFEPNKVNFSTLLENAANNKMLHNIKPISIPLSDTKGLDTLYYKSLACGGSMNQLGNQDNIYKDEYKPSFGELVYSTTIDDLIAGGIHRPNHIKIDVDGNELKILHGMKNLLLSDKRPETIQVEINKGFHQSIPEFLNEHGYTLSSKSYSDAGDEWIKQLGEDAPFNAVFFRS
jgi:FkbM family methyltransferase